MPTVGDTPENVPHPKRQFDWKDWAWPATALLGATLLLPWVPSWLRNAAVVVLWGVGGVGFIATLTVFAVPASNLIDVKPRWTRRPFKFRPTVWLHRLMVLLGLVVVPFVAGHPYLAGCYLAVFVMVLVVPDGTGKETLDDRARPRPVARAVYWTLVTVLRPVMWCFFWWVPWKERRLARRLRAELGIPKAGIYFLHAERHQYEHFFSPDGVLREAADRVVARHWRRDIWPQMGNGEKPPKPGKAERDLLARYRISNLREDLPFVVVIDDDDRLHVSHLNQPYRQRRRDGGEALRDAEMRLRALVYGTG